MADDKKSSEKTAKKATTPSGCSTSSAVYGLGFIGALVYFLQHATSLWTAIIGVGKAIFWPALLIYKVLGMLNM